jgi:hypothetical protein
VSLIALAAVALMMFFCPNRGQKNWMMHNAYLQENQDLEGMPCDNRSHGWWLRHPADHPMHMPHPPHHHGMMMHAPHPHPHEEKPELPQDSRFGKEYRHVGGMMRHGGGKMWNEDHDKEERSSEGMMMSWDEMKDVMGSNDMMDSEDMRMTYDEMEEMMGSSDSEDSASDSADKEDDKEAELVEQALEEDKFAAQVVRFQDPEN